MSFSQSSALEHPDTCLWCQSTLWCHLSTNRTLPFCADSSGKSSISVVYSLNFEVIYIFWICSSRGSRWYQPFLDWSSLGWEIWGRPCSWPCGQHRSRSAPTLLRVQKPEYLQNYWFNWLHYVPQLEKNFGWEIPSSFGDMNFYVNFGWANICRRSAVRAVGHQIKAC